jgi:predicted deacylase
LGSAFADLASGGARVRTIGESVRGAPLTEIAIGPPDAARARVILAGLHALEWIGVEVATELAGRLVRSPPDDALVLVYPIVNVDGFRAVEEDRLAGRRRFRRGNARGVDLNRNWPSFFRRYTVASVLAPWVWRTGGVPAGEPEVRAIVDRLDVLAQRCRIDRALSLHSFGRMVLIPYGALWRRPVGHARLRQAADAVCARASESYRARQVSRWVPGAFGYGMEVDHLHEAYGADALLVECSSGGLRMTDPRSYLDPWRWYNPPDPAPITRDLGNALEPFVRGG